MSITKEFSRAFDSEERKRTSAPDHLNNGCDKTNPYDVGFEDRVCCADRSSNPFVTDYNRDEWFRGFDSADKVGREVAR